MILTTLSLPGLVLITPAVFSDARGYFHEGFSEKKYAEAGITGPFVQDNVSFSKKGVLRGLHFQKDPMAQGKLVSVLRGKVVDVAVDIRRESPTFGKFERVELSGENHRQLWIPPGFAHGFLTLSEDVIFCYKCTNYYSPAHDGGIFWNDPDLAIPWPIKDPIVSEKDGKHPRLIKN
ncbi:MAG: dTDP-4-dehydrorhamnose 3,5-epimerase [Parcubacteria group bacterium Gr01-1014_18]|nr:MAG: dTDP-4-dehydrorhamnose 3,5-epimerase [Parcubacteria group bacterium Greene0416_36]TSC80990.1 MAG: dTDP-4-dehydrorhamnose 3,5-epimerase [Parcubacteria group bacterium Gr01-1014_18]TSC98877.1 MAG: dTDP-4-dehydrorhamnose 3,5-epimerase [Parcubacteria group bacterium Greene1014_20]TSD06537.1 MAG: dTDP-4-dehydrorhamnose 3,5-epimerase [Parcubacteria group bacterium Greene0714_2]